MKKLLFVMSLLLTMLVGNVSAALWCYELRYCKGQAGCVNGGDLNGCTVSCTGGGRAECDDSGEFD